MDDDNRYWVQVGFVDDVPRRGARCVDTPRGRLAMFRTERDEFFATDDRCPHRGGPLSQGIVHGKAVTCPLHNWVIALESGQASGPDEGRVTTYPVRVAGRALLIGLPSARPVERAA